MGTSLRLFRQWSRLIAACSAFLALGCEKTTEPEITLQVGPEEIHRFGADSGFAHYYELAGQGDILRIVLASYPLGCDEYVPPKAGEVFITVTLRVPPPSTIEPGKYPWMGLEVKADDVELSLAPDDDEERAALQASALPFVRLAEDARTLPPGGGVTLTKFEPETFGLVEGELGFRDAEAGQSANAALMGHFSIRLCHLSLDPTRRAPAKLE